MLLNELSLIKSNIIIRALRPEKNFKLILSVSVFPGESYSLN